MNSAAKSLDPFSNPQELGQQKLAEPSRGRKKPIRVLLVDDHPVVRYGIRACLRPHDRVAVIGEATNGQEAVQKAQELGPDLVLMDIDMPEMDGLVATEILRKSNPRIKVLIVTMHNHSEYVLRIVRSGASGYVLKGASAEELVRAIEDAYEGGTC